MREVIELNGNQGAGRTSPPPEAVLFCTLGATPAVVAELLAKIDAAHWPLFGKRRSDYSVRRVVTITSEGQRVVAEELLEWLKKRGVEARVVCVSDTNDVVKTEQSKRMTEGIFRLFAEEKRAAAKADRRFLASLAGGRKTMSASLQEAAFLFGCDRVFHIVGLEDAEGSIKGLPAEESAGQWQAFQDSISHVDLGEEPGLEGVSLLVGPGDATAPDAPSSPGVELLAVDGQSLYDMVRLAARDYSKVGTAYLEEVNRKERLEIFPSLLRLPLKVIRQLQDSANAIGTREEREKDELDWLKTLPKAELHCHLGGILSPQDLDEILATMETQGPRMAKPTEQEVIAELLELRPCGCREARLKDASLSLGIPRWQLSQWIVRALKERTLEKWIFASLDDEATFRGVGIDRYVDLGLLQGSGLLTHEYALTEACSRLARKWEADHVVYGEVRCTPSNYENGSTSADVLANIVKSVSEALAEGHRSSILMMGNRNRPDQIPNEIDLFLKVIPTSRTAGVRLAGFDLAGPERTHGENERRDWFGGMRKSFRSLLEACVPLTIHAGEGTAVENVWSAVYELGADRVGHGLTLIDRKDLMSKFRDRRTAIEMCPSSNDQVVGFWDRKFDGESPTGKRLYPLKMYLDAGLRVTINTDNPGISRTTLSREYLKAARMTEAGLTPWEILAIVRNGFEAAFLPWDEKKRMLDTVDNEVFRLLSGGSLPWLSKS